jgi:hypothetical protein
VHRACEQAGKKEASIAAKGQSNQPPSRDRDARLKLLAKLIRHDVLHVARWQVENA